MTVYNSTTHEVDTSNSISTGLALCVFFEDSNTDPIVGAEVGSNATGAGATGWTQSGTESAEYTIGAVTEAEGTIVFGFKSNGAGQHGYSEFYRSGATGTAYRMERDNSDNMVISVVGSAAKSHTALPNMWDDLPHTITARWKESDGLSGRVDGVLGGGGSTPYNASSALDTTLHIGGLTSGKGTNGTYEFFFVFDRKLSDAEITSLEANPYQVVQLIGSDSTAPILSTPTGTSTSDTTASGAVVTDEGNGTLYYYASTNATETAATIKASGSSQAVSATGSQSVSFTGLTASTTYYAHYVQDDAAANESAVANSTSFTTDAAPDVTAPILSVPTGTKTGETTASGTVTTDEGSGTLYYYASTNATETAVTIKASGASQAVSVSGSQSVSFTGLTASTTYYAHYVQDDAAVNESNVADSTSFTTDAAAMSISSISAGPYSTGDTVTINHVNASASGKTLATSAGSVTLATQNASISTFVVPDPKTFGDKSHRYSQSITFTLTDGVDTDTFALQITPSDDFGTITALTGIYADDIGVSIGDEVHGQTISGVFDVVDLAVGSLSASVDSVYRYDVYDISVGVWLGPADETLIVVDVTAPVVTVTGDNPLTIAQGGTYTELGATAVDNVDGVIAATPSGSVDVNTLDTYTITYTATDAAGNIGTATRTVNVVDVTAPVVTVTGANPLEIIQGGTYTEFGATAVDDTDGVIVATPSGSVNTSIIDTYTVTYTATDAAGNVGTATRTVNVVAAPAPVLSSASASYSSATSAIATVNTDSITGTLYGYVSTNATELAATIKASGSSQAVTSSTESMVFTGLTTDTTYYAHFIQDNGQDSNVITTNSFTPQVSASGDARAIVTSMVSNIASNMVN